MYKWCVHTKKGDFSKLSQKYGIDQVVARVMINRNIEPDRFLDFLHPSRDGLYSYELMRDVDKSARILEECIRENKKIRILGDYDIDGVCATYILKKGLERCNAIVDYAIPHRVEDGYGINDNIVKKAINDGCDCIVTCDNGISVPDVIQMAKDNGLIVIVTDHHGIPLDGDDAQIIPKADAVVNPHRDDCGYPFKDICGAVVAWKLIMALYSHMGVPVAEAYEFIEFAAFATVGDIMPLVDENRCIVSLGLQKLRHTKNIGLRTLISLLGLEGEAISSYHLGFVLGPCINATGRLDSAERAIELLEEEDIKAARVLASELIGLNEERKAMTVDGINAAMDSIKGIDLNDNKVLVVYLPELHESLCGIVAGRLREKYSRPCFVLTDGESHSKGSGRSIPSYQMFEKMQECKELLLQFGGHPMAAGLSLDKDNIDSFTRTINEKCELTDEDLIEKIMIDAPMPISYITTGLVRQLEGLEPFGNGNEKPVFAQKDVVFSGVTYIGKSQKYLKFFIPLNGGVMDGLFFGDSELLKKDVEDIYGSGAWDDFLEGVIPYIKMDVIYFPQINRFRNEESLQIVIKHYRVKERENA